MQADKIIRYFKSQGVFSVPDILAFYQTTEQDIKPTTLNWRIYALVQKGVLQRVGKGKFKLGTEKLYLPEPSHTTRGVFKKLKSEFPFANFCVWDTSVLNEFMQHQSNRNLVLVETEKEITLSVFYYLRGLKKSVFIDPTAEVFDYYIASERQAYIVKPLISEAPTQSVMGIETPTIEKILVDIFCEELVFLAQQGAERRTIFQNAFDSYTINQNKMLRYAGRRGKKEALNKFASSISNVWQS
jgi:hypothetical protein